MFLALSAAAAVATTCPNMTAFRSRTIIDSFDPAKLNGLWYEQAYIDVAQIGATCQTLNSTFVPHEHDWSLPSPSSSSRDTINGNVVMAFKVNYGKIPFTITELYTQNQPPANGSYTKTAEVPGGKLLKLDTVFVDATLSADGTTYDTVTIASCIAPLDAAEVRELIFATRIPTASNATLAAMEATARGLGIEFSTSQLRLVTRNGCP